MGLVFPCPLCGDRVKTRSFEVGDEITCPHCLARAIVPSNAEAFDDDGDPDLDDEDLQSDDEDLRSDGLDDADAEDRHSDAENRHSDAENLRSDDLDDADTGEDVDVADSDEAVETRPEPINGKDLHIRSIPQMLVSRQPRVQPEAMGVDRRWLYGLAIFLVLTALGLILYSYRVSLGSLRELSFGAERVYYGRGTVEDQARRLGEYLAQLGTFDGTGEKSVILTRDAPGYEMAFAIRDEAFEDRAGLATTFEMLADRVSANVFEGAPVTIALTGSAPELLLTLNGLGARRLDDSSRSSEVFLRGEATVEEGRALEAYLSRHRFITPGQSTTMLLHKDDNAYRIAMVLIEAAFDDESRLRASFQELADDLSREVFQGLVVRIDLEDGLLATRVTVSSATTDSIE